MILIAWYHFYFENIDLDNNIWYRKYQPKIEEKVKIEERKKKNDCLQFAPGLPEMLTYKESNKS